MLDRLAELRAAIDVDSLQMQESIDGVLTSEQKSAIAEIKLEVASMIDEATAKAAALEEEVKIVVAESGDDEGDIPGGFDFATDVNYMSDY